MRIQKVNKKINPLILALALSTGLVISACSTDSTNETIQYSTKAINKDNNKDFKVLHAEANQGDPQAQFQLGSMSYAEETVQLNLVN